MADNRNTTHDNTVSLQSFKEEKNQEFNDQTKQAKHNAKELIDNSKGFFVIGIDSMGGTKYSEGGNYDMLRMLGGLEFGKTMLQDLLAEAVEDGEGPNDSH